MGFPESRQIGTEIAQAGGASELNRDVLPEELIHAWVLWEPDSEMAPGAEGRTAMTLSAMVVRKTLENEFVIEMLLTSGGTEPVRAIFDNKLLRKVALDLREDTVIQQDFDLRFQIQCFLPN